MKLRSLNSRNIIYRLYGYEYGFLCPNYETFDKVKHALISLYGYEHYFGFGMFDTRHNRWSSYLYEKGQKQYRWIGISDPKMYTFLRLKL